MLDELVIVIPLTIETYLVDTEGVKLIVWLVEDEWDERLIEA